MPVKSPEGFLDGYHFFINWFSSKQKGVLRHHLEYNGAQCVESLEDFSRPSTPKMGQGLYVMVPYKTPRSDIPSPDDMALEFDVVIDMSLGRFLGTKATKALVLPESYAASTPFLGFPLLGKFPVYTQHDSVLTKLGFLRMRICSTGFTRIDLLHLSKSVDLIGTTYDEYLTPKASILIYNDPRKASLKKLRCIAEWRVPSLYPKVITAKEAQARCP
ncbi:uncharacterized protein N7496_012597 [Penicillium cataractarum]|uniref:Uncharacterized protein n=1 Tax=Penicillium cataractarum TaxID=2100454 RepID=A0A9W9R800_9EURO|nr:uncharacterized protein N7496_012597 [Penicillium cataractarum]KAJ5355385.1 hypothetical protein N7496_012597 [Penicillium cataractarum]